MSNAFRALRVLEITGEEKGSGYNGEYEVIDQIIKIESQNIYYVFCRAEYFYFHVKCGTKATNLTENALDGIQSYSSIFKNMNIVCRDTFKELHCEYTRESINKTCVIHLFTESANPPAKAIIYKNIHTVVQKATPPIRKRHPLKNVIAKNGKIATTYKGIKGMVSKTRVNKLPKSQPKTLTFIFFLN